MKNIIKYINKLLIDNVSSYIESHSTYHDGVNLMGQEHVLKGVMRSTLIHRNMGPR